CRWYKVRGKQTTSLDSIQQVSQQHNLLLIQNVQLEDAGTYMCVINNTVGEEKVETNLLVTASLSAYIQPQQQVIDADKSAEMSCIVSGHPVSTISWSKNGRPIDIDGPFVFPKRDMLQITSIRRVDRGMYQCFVENDEESVQATAEIRL
uniref:Ig-like domain-containing protein n=1 Tax=Strigamia maritima TaxID=126957 RepID=T1JKE8_STRMM